MKTKHEITFPDAQRLMFCELLRLQNETAANEVLASIQNYFRAQPFQLRGVWMDNSQLFNGQFLRGVWKKCMLFTVLFLINERSERKCLLKHHSYNFHFTVKYITGSCCGSN